jgi:hypothetical protein
MSCDTLGVAGQYAQGSTHRGGTTKETSNILGLRLCCCLGKRSMGGVDEVYRIRAVKCTDLGNNRQGRPTCLSAPATPNPPARPFTKARPRLWPSRDSRGSSSPECCGQCRVPPPSCHVT